MIRSAFIWSSLGKYFGFLLQFVSVVVLARLLSPSEIGAFAIAAAILSIAQSFKDLGLTQYLIREDDLTDDKKSAVVFLSFSLCFSIAALLFFFSEKIAGFYGISQLDIIIELLSFNVVIIPFSLLSLASIRRKLNFKMLAYIETAAGFVHVFVSISLAYVGFGVVSLAIASICSTITTSALAYLLNPVRVKSSPNVRSIFSVLNGMSFIGGGHVLIMGQNTIPPLVIGKILGDAAVAFFDKGGAVVNILDKAFFSGIQRVMVPLFSSFKKDLEKASEAYTKVVSVSVAISWPFLLYVGVYSEKVVFILYGDQWDEAASLVPYFCIGISLYNFSRYFSEYMISIGEERKVFGLNLFILLVRVLIVITCAQYGLVFLAKAMLVASFLRFFSVCYLLSNHGGVSLSGTLKEFFKGGLVLFLCSFPIWVVYAMGAQVAEFNVYELVAFFMFVFFIWLYSLFLTKNIIFMEIKKMLSAVKDSAIRIT